MTFLDKFRKLFNSVEKQGNKKIHLILNELELLLRQYDLTREANTIAGTAELFTLNQDKACQLMVAEKWWIGDDAVAEADLSVAGGFTSQARLNQDRFQELIIELYLLLQKEGYDSEFARLVTSQFNKWLVSRM